jgi:iron only hydrogenase large subunit-like protein
MFERINKGEKKYAFIEVMGCTGGCVNGGGQPVISAKVQDRIDVRKERAKAIYGIDDTSKLRESHKNPEVVRLYEDFLKEPCGHVSHKLLHTHYVKREKYSKE